jgi:hypothetical protein
VAGKCLWQGADPYDLAAYNRVHESTLGGTTDAPWYYPPSAAPFFGGLALFEPRAAMFVLAAVNLLSALFIAWLTLVWVTRARPPRPASRWPVTLWLLPALVLATPAVTHWIKTGQVTLPAAALLMGGWLAARSRRDLLAGLLFGLATYKPQYLCLTMLWFLLERRWRLLGVALATSLVLSLPCVLQLGPLPSVTEWLGNLSQYEVLPVNRLGNPLVMGVPSVLTALGLTMPSPLVLLLGGAILVVGLWTFRKRVAPDALPGLILGIHLIFVYGKYADMVLLMPLAAGLWLLTGQRRASWPFLLAGVLLAWVPTRFFLAAGHPAWQHVKMAPIIAGFIALFMLALRPSPGLSDLPRRV